MDSSIERIKMTIQISFSAFNTRHEIPISSQWLRFIESKHNKFHIIHKNGYYI